MGFHDSLHVRAPSELTSDEHAGRLVDSVRDLDLLDLVTQVVLHDLAQVLESLDLLFASGLLLVSLFEFQSLLGDTDELLAFEFLELSDGYQSESVSQRWGQT